MATSTIRQKVEREVYSTEQVATLLGVDLRTVKCWIANGQIPSFRIGHCRRIRKDVIEAIMNPTCSVQPRVGDWETAEDFISLLRPDRTS